MEAAAAAAGPPQNFYDAHRILQGTLCRINDHFETLAMGSCRARNGLRAVGVKELLASTRQMDAKSDEKVACFVDNKRIHLIRHERLTSLANVPSSAVKATERAQRAVDNALNEAHDALTFGHIALEGLPLATLAREVTLGCVDVIEAGERGRCVMGIADLLLWDSEERCVVVADVKTCTEPKWNYFPLSFRFLKRLHLLQIHLYAHLLERVSEGRLRVGYGLLIGFDPSEERAGRLGVWRIQLSPPEEILYADPCAFVKQVEDSPYYMRWLDEEEAAEKAHKSMKRICQHPLCDTGVMAFPDNVLPRKPLLRRPAPAPEIAKKEPKEQQQQQKQKNKKQQQQQEEKEATKKP